MTNVLLEKKGHIAVATINRPKALKEELFNLRFQMATGSLTNPQRVRECKKDVARIKTLLCERQLKAAE